MGITIRPQTVCGKSSWFPTSNDVCEGIKPVDLFASNLLCQQRVMVVSLYFHESQTNLSINPNPKKIYFPGLAINLLSVGKHRYVSYRERFIWGYLETGKGDSAQLAEGGIPIDEGSLSPILESRPAPAVFLIFFQYNEKIHHRTSGIWIAVCFSATQCAPEVHYCTDIKAVNFLASLTKGICQYPLKQSNVEKYFLPERESRQSSIRGSGNLSLTVFLFKGLKFTQKRIESSFFFTRTTCDDHSDSDGTMTPASNILVISDSIIPISILNRLKTNRSDDVARYTLPFNLRVRPTNSIMCKNDLNCLKAAA